MSLIEESSYRGVLAAQGALKRMGIAFATALALPEALNSQRMDGLQILAELHDRACTPQLLLEAAALVVVGMRFHGFGTPQRPAGATGVHTASRLEARCRGDCGVREDVNLR